MGKYKVFIVDGDNIKEKEVDGEPVHFAGYEDFQFFSHQLVESDKWGNWDHHLISEVSSGCRITGGFTLEEAIAKAGSILSKDTPEGLRLKVNEFLDMKKEAGL